MIVTRSRDQDAAVHVDAAQEPLPEVGTKCVTLGVGLCMAGSMCLRRTGAASSGYYVDGPKYADGTIGNPVFVADETAAELNKIMILWGSGLCWGSTLLMLGVRVRLAPPPPRADLARTLVKRWLTRRGLSQATGRYLRAALCCGGCCRAVAHESVLECWRRRVGVVGLRCYVLLWGLRTQTINQKRRQTLLLPLAALHFVFALLMYVLLRLRVEDVRQRQRRRAVRRAASEAPYLSLRASRARPVGWLRACALL